MVATALEAIELEVNALVGWLGNARHQARKVPENCRLIAALFTT
jgi:hypothetical protein